MIARAIRDSFLDYFRRQGHRIVPSASLVPADDATLLFTNAGMNQFKDVFLGKERRDYARAASSQKCMRVSGKHNDLDNVGPSLRHHTFFEMLGNFSFGNYFKVEAIAYAWDLLTTVWGLTPNRLYATIFHGEAGIPRDDEAYAAWQKFLPADRISELGLAENFWSMGDTGPCGRCSEIHYFCGADVLCREPVCRGLQCDCDRYIEVWNNVFMEFDRQADRTLMPLADPSIDTGMGLERISAVLQGKRSNYDTDLFTPILATIADRAGVRYGADAASDVSMRVIADHLRATTFLVADGVVPSNEWRGYVLRKIMRRAMRHGKMLGFREPFLHDLVDVLVATMGDAYPELQRGRDGIVQAMYSEEERFDTVLNNALPRLEHALDRAAATTGVIPGEEIFRLYDSLGLPLDFVEDLAGQRHLTIDREGFERAMQEQRERARAASAFEARKTQPFVWASETDRQMVEAAGDRFVGYTTTHVPGVSVLAVFDDARRQVSELGEGAAGYAVLEQTPFYVEAGGQVFDTGCIQAETGTGAAIVEDVQRLAAGAPRAHRVRVTHGVLRPRDLVTATVDEEARDATRRNHTATHLLHAALRQLLGTHVRQAGSLVAPDRLRFDFVHFAPLGAAQIDEIERLVNAQIHRNAPVQTEIRATEAAIAAGAMALFGEKYGDHVRVVSIPDFSLELCGGTHCRATGDIGFFTIVQEVGIAAGVRRLEALTGVGALRYYQTRRASLASLVDALGAPEDQAVDAARRLHTDLKRLQRENDQLKMRAALGELGGEGPEELQTIENITLVPRRVLGVNREGLRSLADAIKAKHAKEGKRAVVILSSEQDGKVSIVVSVTADLAKLTPAGEIVKELAPIVGGGGGGRPDFAEAGGKDPSKIDELLRAAPRVLRDVLARARRP